MRPLADDSWPRGFGITVLLLTPLIFWAAWNLLIEPYTAAGTVHLLPAYGALFLWRAAQPLWVELAWSVREGASLAEEKAAALHAEAERAAAIEYVRGRATEILGRDCSGMDPQAAAEVVTREDGE